MSEIPNPPRQTDRDGILAPIPDDDAQRVSALRALGILETPPEERFDRIVRLAATIFDTPISYISLVDRDRQWFKAKVGLEVEGSSRDVSFCGHAILYDDVLVVPDALLDRRFADNPMVVGEPGVRFYAGHPFRERNGNKIGTLCLMDTAPRQFDEKERLILRQLVTLVEHEIHLVDLIELQEETLRVKEQLIESKRDLEKLFRELEVEKTKSDDLLLNILPEAIADELKESGAVEAEVYENVCVLVTDFTDFTRLSEKMLACDLVSELNFCFSEFDDIVERHGVERLKTIGDGYLCVAGIPECSDEAPLNVLRAAFEIRDFIANRVAEAASYDLERWNVRIGIHSGSLVAGVVGKRKFAFDVWGDTVNTAFRLQSVGATGKINISRAFHDRIADAADCEARGHIMTKSKGEMEMFFVHGLR
jgi:adenylate cyclase